MGTITGKITNKFKEPIENAIVSLKNKSFDDLYTTYTDKDGNYEIEAESMIYPYLFAVKDFAVENLEFWCQDINLENDIEMSASIGKLEVYGLNVFKIDGGCLNTAMVYFRPMSLIKYLNGDKVIYPDLDSIEVKINGIKSEVHIVNEVDEYAGNEESMKACLINVSTPEEGLKEKENYLLVQIIDKDGNLGQAGRYFTFNK